ncbi:MAG: hypothetical protein H7A38_03475 [Chlamydiales bacterium]|nr:hypothetical protein [Chlamydiales bacterium]
MSSIYPYYQMISGIDRSYERSAKSSVSWVSWTIGWIETMPLLGKIVAMIDRLVEQLLSTGHFLESEKQTRQNQIFLKDESHSQGAMSEGGKQRGAAV